MDLKSFLLWFRPHRNEASEQDANRLERARTRNAILKADMPKITLTDGKKVMEQLEQIGQNNVHSFMLWLEFQRHGRATKQ